MNERIEGVLEHDVAPLPQSSGRVLPGGDCGFCCVAGLLQLPTILAAYEHLEARMPGTWTSRSAMDPWRMATLLRSHGLEPREHRPKHRYYKTGASAVPWKNLHWIDGVEAALRGGSVGVASIRFNRSAPPAPGTSGDSDHNVLITGHRTHWVPASMPGVMSIDRELRVSCSVKGHYWMEWSELVYWHGCSPLFFVDVQALRAARDVRIAVTVKNDEDDV